MKILRVASDLYPYVVGGVCLHVHDLSKDQADSGHDVTVYTCIADSQLDKKIPTNYTIQNFGRKFVIAGNTISPKMFVAIMQNCTKYDVVHAHSHLYLSTFICAVMRRLRKFNFVVTNHGLISQTVPSWFQTMYNATFGRVIFSMADMIITYTSEEARLISRWENKSDNLRIIPNGIKTERFLSPLDVQKKNQILWVGRYVPGKGVKYLLEGFSKFALQHPEYSLLMIGQGPEKQQDSELAASLGVGDKVQMIDFVPNTEIRTLYAESSLFISSSLAEGVPKTMLEAMVCGLPVVSTDLPQLVDIVDGCGVLVPCKDSRAIADALSYLVSSPEVMMQCSRNAREKVLTSYDWNEVVRQTNAAFSSLAAGGA